MGSNRFVQGFLVAMIGVLVAAGFYTSVMIRERQEALAHIFRYNVAYTASQAVIEFERLQNALLRLQRVQSPTNLEEAQLRFEILYNRAEVFEAGELATFLREDPERLRMAARLKEAVQALDTVLTDPGAGMSVSGPLALLAALEKDLIGLASEANRHGAQLIALDQRDLLSLHQRYSILTLGLVICGLCLVGMLSWNNRLLKRAHADLSVTTAELRSAAADLSSANHAVAAANGELRAQNRLLVEKEDALRAQNALFDAALNNMSQGLCMFGPDMRAIVFNQQLERLFGGAPTVWSAGSALRDMAPDLSLELEENVRRSRAASFETECADGRIIAVAQRPMSGGGWVATFEDVSEQRRAQARIAHMARHDGLTNLPNRYAFRERIQEALQECAAAGGTLAVMCVDLDNFKEVNDTLGHPTGDMLLCAAAERLVGCIRETDMVARFGGDEFAILQLCVEGRADAERLAARLVEAMRKPFVLNGELVYATGSFGVAVSPEHGHDPDALLKNADLALYAAKADGRRTHRFFEPEMDERLAARHALERDLRLAIQRGEFELHYQPVVHLRSRKTTGLEALLRWVHPARGNVPPADFIPLAEDTGLIVEIGRWVLNQACADAVDWPAHLKVAVNLSAAQFSHGDIAAEVGAALRRTGLDGRRLVVEITESLLLTEKKATLDTLRRLKAIGVDIAMDDFGTGYSSLSYLRNYPFDRIKIDRSFVNTASRGDQGAAIIQTIVHLGASLGMTTIAEGVETDKDLELVLAAGCLEGQGYLFSPPVPRHKVLDLVGAGAASISKVA